MAELKELAINGPDLAIDKVMRWRCVDLREVVTERFAVTASERTIGKSLREMQLTRLELRHFHPKKDEAAKVALKNFANLEKEALLSSATLGGKSIEVWFQDEARVGQKGPHAYVWAPLGSRPLMVKDDRHDSSYLFGAACPDRAVGAPIIVPAVNTEVMNEHLKEISTQVAAGSHAVAVRDGARFRQAGGELSVPDNITLLSLPPYAPELNPMELVWEYLRGNKLCAVVWDTYDAIVATCRNA